MTQNEIDTIRGLIAGFEFETCKAYLTALKETKLAEIARHEEPQLKGKALEMTLYQQEWLKCVFKSATLMLTRPLYEDIKQIDGFLADMEIF